MTPEREIRMLKRSIALHEMTGPDYQRRTEPLLQVAKDRLAMLEKQVDGHHHMNTDPGYITNSHATSGPWMAMWRHPITGEMVYRSSNDAKPKDKPMPVFHSITCAKLASLRGHLGGPFTIAFTAPKKTGKDTTARRLHSLPHPDAPGDPNDPNPKKRPMVYRKGPWHELYAQGFYHIDSCARPLYEMVAVLTGLTVDQLQDPAIKDTTWAPNNAPTPSLVGWSPRTLMEQLGSGFVRDRVGKDHWAQLLANRLRGKQGVAIITDVRFVNEAALCDLVVELRRFDGDMQQPGDYFIPYDERPDSEGGHDSKRRLPSHIINATYQLTDTMLNDNAKGLLQFAQWLGDLIDAKIQYVKDGSPGVLKAPMPRSIGSAPAHPPLPPSCAATGSQYHDRDTGSLYEWDGKVWNKVGQLDMTRGEALAPPNTFATEDLHSPHVQHYAKGAEGIGQDGREGWYFSNEVHQLMGPFMTEGDAVRALNKYAEEL